MLLTNFSNHEKPLKNSPWSNHWFIHLLWHRRSASWCPWAPGKSQDFAKMWGKRRGNDGKMLGKWLGKWVEKLLRNDAVMQFPCFTWHLEHGEKLLGLAGHKWWTEYAKKSSKFTKTRISSDSWHGTNWIPNSLVKSEWWGSPQATENMALEHVSTSSWIEMPWHSFVLGIPNLIHGSSYKKSYYN